MIYLGIDNGASGSVAFVDSDGTATYFGPVPVYMTQDYTKKSKNVSRLKLLDFSALIAKYGIGTEIRAFLERPMVNPGRFVATASALRFLEATLIALEAMAVPVQFLDSKEWQRQLLPAGTPDLKKASADIGCRLFPQWADAIRKQKDADGLLIAEWARRNVR